MGLPSDPTSGYWGEMIQYITENLPYRCDLYNSVIREWFNACVHIFTQIRNTKAVKTHGKIFTLMLKDYL